MPIIGDVFGLTSIYERQVENIDNNNFESWPESATYGYFGGGGLEAPQTSEPAANYVCTIDRIDFSNETTSAPGNGLPQARYGLAAVSSSSYGYFGGGARNYQSTGGPGFSKIDTIDRIDFSNETTSAPGNNLTQARNSLAAVSSSSYGYFGGGFAPGLSPGYLCTIDRLDFSNETLTVPGTGLPQARNSLAAVSSNSYGYFGGGWSPSAVCTIDRLDFSNETLTVPGTGLPQARRKLAEISSNSYGYFAGGTKTNSANEQYAQRKIYRIDFSNETLSTPSNNLTEAIEQLAAVSSSSYGYFGGGYKPPKTAGIYSSVMGRVDRIDFSNDTTSAPGNNLTQARRNLEAVSGGASQRIKGSRTYGYFGGGQTSISVCTIDRLDFSNETRSVPGTGLPQGRYDLAAVSSNSYGYFGSGYRSSYVCTIDRLDFSNETVTVPGDNLSQARGSLAAVSSNSYGYFGGGFSPPYRDTIDRIDFSNDTVLDTRY